MNEKIKELYTALNSISSDIKLRLTPNLEKYNHAVKLIEELEQDGIYVDQNEKDLIFYYLGKKVDDGIEHPEKLHEITGYLAALVKTKGFFSEETSGAIDGMYKACVEKWCEYWEKRVEEGIKIDDCLKYYEGFTPLYEAASFMNDDKDLQHNINLFQVDGIYSKIEGAKSLDEFKKWTIKYYEFSLAITVKHPWFGETPKTLNEDVSNALEEIKKRDEKLYKECMEWYESSDLKNIKVIRIR